MEKSLPEIYESKKMDLSSLGISGFAWDRESILKFLSDESTTDFVVLGGNVYLVESGAYKPANANWYVTHRGPTEAFKHYAERARARAKTYIEGYPKGPPDVVFSPVITSEPTAGLKAAR
jgi:Immunity protein 40